MACPDSNDSHLPMRLETEAFSEPSRSHNDTQEYLLVRQYDLPSYDRGIGGLSHVTALTGSRATRIKIKTFHFTHFHLFQQSFMCWRTRDSNPLMSGIVEDLDLTLRCIHFKPHNPRGAYLWHRSSLG
ncbi:hypothetical protein PITC_026740 [Penicillium italicum]|uniref:Uncharacterized protein n=1 Tax=Penicillium italicum TaxID=40296 RepID=A0A0A2KVY2_PENIT|nr:hypothetical protein PITC_026740 [Penicillium italicum]